MLIRERGLEIEIRKRMRGQNSNRRKVHPSGGVRDVGGVVRWDIFRRTASRRRMEKAKVRRRISRISQRVMDLMLDSLLAESDESWVIDSDASFHVTS